jgi:hypothetical protein
LAYLLILHLIQVTPAAGIIRPNHIVEVSVHHDEFQTLEEFVDGVPQNWWCEDNRDKEVILVVKVRGSHTTETRNHRVRVRQPRQNGLTLHQTALRKSREPVFTGLIFNASAVPVMWLTSYAICRVLKVEDK